LKKIQQFQIFKFSTDRLKETNYKIANINLEQARKNGEVISIAESEMQRVLFREKNREFSPYQLEQLHEEKHKLSKKKNSVEFRKRFTEVNSKIDNMLFIEDIISLKIIDKRHYQAIIKKGGISVNGKMFVPFIFSAGLIRRNSGLLIEASIKDKILEILENGRNKDIELVAAKHNSYMGLYSSSSLRVSTPRFAVVPDLILKRTDTMDYGEYIGDGIEPSITEKEVTLEYSAFDGGGLISPSMAKKWSKDLELDDYVASTFIIRFPWGKGLLSCFDFKLFSEEISKNNIFLDIYGKEINISKTDVIISESQFKLWNCYNNTEEYNINCLRNGLGWSVTQVNPKNVKSFAKMSYQYLQTLNLNDYQIEKVCEPTLNWLSYSSGGTLESSLLYGLGEIDTRQKNWFNQLSPIFQSVIFENDLIKDSYFVAQLDNSLLKKKHDAKKGNIYLNGNYQFVIPDLFLYCQHIFGLQLEPLLHSGEIYSKYWNDKDVSIVAGVRSPLTFESEVLYLNVIDNDETKKWFKYIESGLILPANGIGLEFLLASGMDGDGDSLCTINSKEFLEGRVSGLPVTYEIIKAPKYLLNNETENLLYEAQMKGFNTKVGFITNLSSTYYSMLYNFEKGTQEYIAILNRLKWGKNMQSMEIDKQKGILIPPIPSHWTKFKKMSDDMTEDEKLSTEFNNSILCDKKRPYFFIYLYDHYMRRYKKELNIYDNICLTRFGLTFEEVKALSEKSQEQHDIINRYNRKTYFIDNNSIMNRICHHMERLLKEIKTLKSQTSKDFNYEVLTSKNFSKPSKRNIEKFTLLHKEYKSLKRNFQMTFDEYADNDYSSLEEIYKFINNKAYATITSNSEELGNLAIYCCYEELGIQSKSYMWNCYGKEITSNIKSKRKEKFVRIPLPKENGTIEYLWKNYSWYNINIEE